MMEPGMAVNFGGVGKGFALDRMREELAARGVANALLDFGGSSWLALGVPDDAPAWRVLLRDGRGGFAGAVTLRDASASFSDSFGESSEIEGRRFGHVLDPRTGWPIAELRAGFAIASDGTTAEALTKALLVLDPGEALALVARVEGAEALVLDASGARHESPGFGRATQFEAAR
jgi:thiamine biosynthesis lipoprotein